MSFTIIISEHCFAVKKKKPHPLTSAALPDGKNKTDSVSFWSVIGVGYGNILITDNIISYYFVFVGRIFVQQI